MSSQSKGLLINDGGIGVVSVFGQHIAVLDLSDGRIIWIKETPGRPVAVTARHVVVVETAPRPHLVVHDLRTGSILVETQGAEFPKEAVDAVDQSDAQIFRADEEGERVTVEWELRDMYRGGAAPVPQSKSQNVHAGRVALNIADGTFQSEERTAPFTKTNPESLHRQSLRGPARLTGELERTHMRHKDYVLHVETNTSAEQVAKVTALNSATGKIVWETEIGRSKISARPSPLRG